MSLLGQKICMSIYYTERKYNEMFIRIGETTKKKGKNRELCRVSLMYPFAGPVACAIESLKRRTSGNTDVSISIGID